MKFLVVFLLILLFWDGLIGLIRKRERRRIYSLAEARKNETGKKLLVIGDPDNGITNVLTGRDYKCGDTCVDITGCGKCTNGVSSKMEDYIPKLETNSCVIFISCVLEYIDKLTPEIVSELNRVSNGDLFIVRVNSNTLSSRFYYGRYFTGENNIKRIIKTCPPYTKEIIWEEK